MVNGNINAFCSRVWKKYNIRLMPISVNKFMDIKYPRNIS